MGSKQVEKIDVNSAAPKFFRGVRKKWVCRSCSGFLHEVIVAVVQDAPSPPLPFFFVETCQVVYAKKGICHRICMLCRCSEQGGQVEGAAQF